MEVHEHFFYGCFLFELLQAGMWHLERMDSGRVFSFFESLCFATLCCAKCCLRFERFNVQVADSVVKEVYMKRRCVRGCSAEALRLRKKLVKTLSLCRRKYYVNVMTRRKKHALARLQLVLYASIVLNSGVN